MNKDWNPRYLAYARAHGRTPEEMVAYDDQRREAGTIDGGFVVWISERWREWAALRGIHPSQSYAHHHAAFDAWLMNRFLEDTV